MTAFSCETRDANGRRVQKVLRVDSAAEAMAVLEAAGLFPIEIQEILESQAPAAERAAEPKEKPAVAEGRTDRRLKPKVLLNFTLQTGAMLDAGVPILALLESFVRQTDDPVFAAILTEMRDDLSSGMSFSQAMQQHPKAFPELYASTVAAGEQSGTLGLVLDNLADYLETNMEIRADVRSALMYPAAVLATLGLAVIALVVFVIPRFSSFYAGMQGELPLPTRVLMGVSSAVVNYGALCALGVTAAIVALVRWARTERGRTWIDLALLKVPVIGHLLRTASTLHTAQMIGLFSRAGIPVLQGLRTISETIGSPSARKEVLAVAEGISAGETLSDSMERAECMSPSARQMISVGESSGSIEPACDAVVRHFKKELRYITKNLGTLIEPVLTVCLAVIVLFVALAVFMPMWDLIKVVGK